ncbi:MAG: UDP-N-acetylglucosamine 2-epimerase (hydrolyzing) [Candidatus Omnitrophica bacterium]|nr:UDP-N-acetylglucosamine 2-epimerase (hydrolyzing) [Candidatus Omnitrophota bacterium]
MKKKILAITGIRSEYDILYPVIKDLDSDARFDLRLAVCGTHLSAWHGYTASKVESDGFNITERIAYLSMSDKEIQRSKGVSILVDSLAKAVKRQRPDILLVVGDREESIAAAIVCNYMNVLFAHIGGGDTVFGNADDPIRFAASKLAHIHLATSRKSAENLLNIGEEKFRVFNVGNPGLDNIRMTPVICRRELSRMIGFDISGSDYLVFIKHPLSSEVGSAYSQMDISLRALKKFCLENGLKTVASYPNSDPGSPDMLKVIKRYGKESFIRFYKTMPRDIFVNLMRNALALAGNSSMGILEAPFYKLPVVNIGNRQKGRFHCGNVEFSGYDIKAIKKALRRACFDRKYRKRVFSLKNPFGGGRSAQKIKDILAAIDPKDKKWLVKHKMC